MTDRPSLDSNLRRARAVLGAFAVGAAVAALLAAGSGTHASTRTPRRAPARLVDTGLYSDFASRRVDPRNVRYSPQYPLWSDGADKERWVRLPPGTRIDARDPDHWVFPVGTRFWKQFSWSRPIETRYLELTPAGWIYAVYVWTEDGSDAVLAPKAGVLSHAEVAPGRRHAIPSEADCLGCHRAGRAEVLGFTALQLSPDRDPLAPHAEAVREGDLNLATLAERGLLRGLPPDLLRPPPRIDAPTPRGRAALGYLHANCGTCHDSRGPLAPLGVSLRQALRPGEARAQPAAEVIGHPTQFTPPGVPPGGGVWIAPGAPSASAVVQRMQSRNPAVQMPPLATQVVDAEAVTLVREWIEQELLPAARREPDVQPRRSP